MVAPVAPCGGQQEREQEDGATHTESHVSNNTCKRPACACVKAARDQPGKALPALRLPGVFEPLGAMSLRSEQYVQQLPMQNLAYHYGRETQRIMTS